MGKNDFKLGNVQFEFMKIIWRKREATVRDVYEEMLKRRKISYSTVLTMMRDLETKGLLTHESVNRTYIYKPVCTRREISGGIIRDIMSRIFDGSAEALVSRLLDDEGISSEELAHIKDVIARKEQELDEGMKPPSA